MTSKERAAHFALMVLKQITSPSMTLAPEEFAALTQEVRDSCADAGIEPVDLYSYVVGKNRDIEDAIRYSGLRQQSAGACLRFH